MTFNSKTISEEMLLKAGCTIGRSGLAYRCDGRIVAKSITAIPGAWELLVEQAEILCSPIPAPTGET